MYPPISEPSFPICTMRDSARLFLKIIPPLGSQDAMIQIKMPSLQPHPVSAPSLQGHRSFGPGTQGRGVAALKLQSSVRAW